MFHFNPTDVERLILHPDHPTRHIHHKANSIGSGDASEDHDYLHAAAESIADAGAVLITAPANAKTELVKHIHHHDPQLMNVIVGVENCPLARGTASRQPRARPTSEDLRSCSNSGGKADIAIGRTVPQTEIWQCPKRLLCPDVEENLVPPYIGERPGLRA